MSPESEEAFARERRARAWDRWTTGVIFLLLLIPLPIARFQSWPGGEIVLDRLVLPWSHFRICYVSLADGNPVEEVHRFRWNGRLQGGEGVSPLNLEWISMGPAMLKWQDAPEILLSRRQEEGQMLRMKVLWRPVLLWPLEALWHLAK